MRELSHEALDLVSAGREAFRPTDADRARVLAAVMSAAPLVGGAAVLSVSKASMGGLVHVLRGSRIAKVLAVAMPVAAAGGVAWYASVNRPAARSLELTPAVPTGAAISAPAALPQAEETPVPPEEPAPAQAAATPDRPAASTTDSNSGGQIRQEVALLSRAQAELSRGRAQQALEALKEHAQRFPRGALTNERIATRARALCALGRTQEANADLDRMERLNPGSPYWVRAREACSGK
jgi:hypothetical protein